MNTLGIIAEYNPFHKGHLYHLQESMRQTEASTCVAVMSGDFTQRGTPALVSKWTRAQMAVDNGIDLVLELPFVYACNNAEYFAYGAVKLLSSLSCVTHLSFGSEHGNLTAFTKAAQVLSAETEAFQKELKQQLDRGLSFPKARYEAIRTLYGECSNVLQSPNNILAVEYLKQIAQQSSKLTPHTIKRMGAGYHEETTNEAQFSSATGIRDLLRKEQWEAAWNALPEPSAKLLNGRKEAEFFNAESFFPLLMHRISTSSVVELSQILSVSEGLEHRMKEAIKRCRSMEELCRAIKSKRYTETRIQRILTHTLLGLTKEAFFQMHEAGTCYARVLAMSTAGAKLLKDIKKKELSSIPVLTNINREIPAESPIKEMIRYDILASDLCNLIRFGELYSRSDHRVNPYRKTEAPIIKNCW